MLNSCLIFVYLSIDKRDKQLCGMTLKHDNNALCLAS